MKTSQFARVGFATAAIASSVLIAACVGQAPPSPPTASPMPPVPVTSLRPAADFAAIADARSRSVALFQEAGKVLQSPRCLNCHPRDDTPRQGDRMTVHMPPVTRGADNHGAVAMRCETCHNRQNFEFGTGRSLPGSKDWHLAPIEMAWVGRTLGQICEQIKDPRRNGGKSMAQIVDHMANDELVGWGWNPGSGRTPAPGDQKAFGALIGAWVASGAHCPA